LRFAGELEIAAVVKNFRHGVNIQADQPSSKPALQYLASHDTINTTVR
jgi:hypothetical protein